MDDFWNVTSIAKDLDDYVSVVKRNEADHHFAVDRFYEISRSMIEKTYCCIENIEVDFYIHKRISKTVPQVSKIKISLINSLVAHSDVDLDQNDPISRYAFDMLITGFNGKDEYKMAWHLDKNIEAEGDGAQKYTHPLYHFQLGGKHMEGIGTGELMLMGAPRLPHPPMDIFLSIHFVLSNYFNKEDDDYFGVKNLFIDPDYNDILERAKNRMWYPYFRGLTDSTGVHSDLNLSNLFPLAASM